MSSHFFPSFFPLIRLQLLFLYLAWVYTIKAFVSHLIFPISTLKVANEYFNISLHICYCCSYLIGLFSVTWFFSLGFLIHFISFSLTKAFARNVKPRIPYVGSGMTNTWDDKYVGWQMRGITNAWDDKCVGWQMRGMINAWDDKCVGWEVEGNSINKPEKRVNQIWTQYLNTLFNLRVNKVVIIF